MHFPHFLPSAWAHNFHPVHEQEVAAALAATGHFPSQLHMKGCSQSIWHHGPGKSTLLPLRHHRQCLLSSLSMCFPTIVYARSASCFSMCVSRRHVWPLLDRASRNTMALYCDLSCPAPRRTRAVTTAPCCPSWFWREAASFRLAFTQPPKARPGAVVSEVGFGAKPHRAIRPYLRCCERSPRGGKAGSRRPLGFLDGTRP